MAYKFTLRDAKENYALKQVASSCPESQTFIDEVNEAQGQLLRRGSFYSTESLVQICYHDSCITWPRYVGTVEGMRFGDGTPAQVKNQWYTILAGIGQYGQIGQYGGSWGGVGFGSAGAWSGYPGAGYLNGGFFATSTLQYTDYSPFYRKIYGCTGKYLRVYALKREDWGKTITFFGKDWQGQPLQQRNLDGVWISGLTVTLGNDLGNGFVQTNTKIREVTSVTKDLTVGNVMVYEWDIPDPVEFPITVNGTLSVNDDYTWNGTQYISSGNNTITKVGDIWVFLEDADPAFESLTDDIFGSWKLSPGTVTAPPFPVIYPTSVNSGQMIDLAVYEPSETNPRYRQSMVQSFAGKCRTADGQCSGCVIALVKLAFIPLVSENDFLLIDCFDAIAFQIQSNRYSRAGDVQRKQEYQALAIQELNAELRAQFPDNETTVSVQVTPSAIRSAF